MLNIPDGFFNKKNPFSISAEDQKAMNFNEYVDTFNRLFELATKSIKINGLDNPKLVAIREQTLIYIWAVCGQYCLEEVEPERFMFKPCYPGSLYTPELYPTTVFNWNLNGGKSTEIKAYIPGADVKANTWTPAGYKRLDNFKCVYGQCNTFRRPIIYNIWNTAKRLVDIQQSLDIIAISTKRPVILTAPEESIKTLKAMWQKVRDNEPLITGYQGHDPKTLQAVDLGYKIGTLKEVEEYYEYIENMFLLHYAIDVNPQADKKERVLNNETQITKSQKSMYFEILTYGLNEFFKNIKDAYGIELEAVPRVNEELDAKEELENEEENNIEELPEVEE